MIMATAPAIDGCRGLEQNALARRLPPPVQLVRNPILRVGLHRPCASPVLCVAGASPSQCRNFRWRGHIGLTAIAY